jgi:hypothetical protein
MHQVAKHPMRLENLNVIDLLLLILLVLLFLSLQGAQVETTHRLQSVGCATFLRTFLA